MHNLEVIVCVIYGIYTLQSVRCETRSMIMTLAVCYHARIQEREKFEDHICPYFGLPLEKIDKTKFQQEISRFILITFYKMWLHWGDWSYQSVYKKYW